MEMKKSKKADLKNKQGLFLQVGLLVALAIVFASFQWSVEERHVPDIIGVNIDNFEFDMTPVTRPEKPKEEIPKPKALAEKYIISDDPDLDDTEVFIEEYTDDYKVNIIGIEDDIEPEEKDPEYFIVVEDMPQFPGGDIALFKFIAQNVEYPEIARENGIQGKVFLSFIINKKGFVEQVKVTRNVDPLLDKEAMRVIQLLPKWKPGKQRGKAVNVAFNVPINFQLN